MDQELQKSKSSFKLSPIYVIVFVQYSAHPDYGKDWQIAVHVISQDLILVEALDDRALFFHCSVHLKIQVHCDSFASKVRGGDVSVYQLNRNISD